MIRMRMISVPWQQENLYEYKTRPQRTASQGLWVAWLKQRALDIRLNLFGEEHADSADSQSPVRISQSSDHNTCFSWPVSWLNFCNQWSDTSVSRSGSGNYLVNTNRMKSIHTARFFRLKPFNKTVWLQIKPSLNVQSFPTQWSLKKRLSFSLRRGLHKLRGLCCFLKWKWSWCVTSVMEMRVAMHVLQCCCLKYQLRVEISNGKLVGWSLFAFAYCTLHSLKIFCSVRCIEYGFPLYIIFIVFSQLYPLHLIEQDRIILVFVS